MAVVKGIREKVHLPLYDSLFVRPGQQLWEIEGTSVFKFFINVLGKTKLETNMQSASVLPHWNTFEARALRVVISDLPPKFPADVEECLNASSPADDEQGAAALARVLDNFSTLTASEKAEPVAPLLTVTQRRLSAFIEEVRDGSEIPPDLDECLQLLRDYYDPRKMRRLLSLHSDLKAIRADLSQVIRRTRVRVAKQKEVEQFADKLDALDDGAEEREQIRRLKKVEDCLGAFGQLTTLINRIRETVVEEPPISVTATDPVAPAPLVASDPLVLVRPSRDESLARMQTDLLEVRAALDRVSATSGQASEDDIRQRLDECLSDKQRIPLDEQLFGRSAQLFAKIIFNSVMSFFVGEKVMIQMPTWFFPAGGGPYSGNGRVTSHGFPGPEATFRFAEPVMIDAQQNFRVEMEIPDTVVLGELRRIYGPFFIWVTLDGYMRRDVQ